MSDALGDRMKSYEAYETARRFLPLQPVYTRIDGRSFSAFTKGMGRPYDPRLTRAMIDTTKGLVEKTHARIGYTQSDEISLVWYSDTVESGYFFDGKIMKMTSVLASLATAIFTASANDHGLGMFMGRLPHFDCRVIQIPTQTEAANMFLWRELDATKNAISMAARAYYSHKELDHKNGPEMQEMLFAKGINFNDYPAAFKRGTFVRRITRERPFTSEELARIPDAHRPPTGQMVARSEIVELEMPKFSTVTNREAVIFDGADPDTSKAGASFPDRPDGER